MQHQQHVCFQDQRNSTKQFRENSPEFSMDKTSDQCQYYQNRDGIVEFQLPLAINDDENFEDDDRFPREPKRRWFSADHTNSTPQAVQLLNQNRRFSEPDRPEKRFRLIGYRFSSTAEHTIRSMKRLSSVTFAAVSPDDENPERGTWSNQFEFFLSCLGFAVGLGNVWRFPFLCYQDGGGAFLIPFIVMLVLCGIPLLLLEFIIGQYASEGPLTMWKISPLFKGVGIGMVMVSIYLAAYYNVITGWAFYYLFVSLREVLPWSYCEPSWLNCVSFWAETNGTAAAFNTSASLIGPKLFAADFYFHRNALALSPTIDDVGTIQWHQALCLFVAWLVVFGVLMRGIKSIGKIVYFTSIFPYFVLIILFIRALLEPGALDGIKFLLVPKWSKLLEANVWGDALVQVFYSTSVCTGGIITLASYNRFHNNIVRDTIILGVGNLLTSIFSGCVVFAILGFMAHHQHTTIDEIVTRGPGLTFITYPQAVTLLYPAPLWSALFFLMLITLALSSMFPTVENVTTAIIDQFPDTLRSFKLWVTLLNCVCLFLLGLSMTTNGGMYVLQILDKYAVGWALVVIGLFEIFVVVWRYGHRRLASNLEAMVGTTTSFYWTATWTVLCPLLLIFCFVFSMLDFAPLSYGSYRFPGWTDGVGWALAMSSFLPVPGFALFYLCRMRKKWHHLSFYSLVKHASTALPSWRPARPENRALCTRKLTKNGSPAAATALHKLDEETEEEEGGT